MQLKALFILVMLMLMAFAGTHQLKASSLSDGEEEQSDQGTFRLSELPEEVFLNTLQFLLPSDVISTSMVSKKFRSIANDFGLARAIWNKQPELKHLSIESSYTTSGFKIHGFLNFINSLEDSERYKVADLVNASFKYTQDLQKVFSIIANRASYFSDDDRGLSYREMISLAVLMDMFNDDNNDVAGAILSGTREQYSDKVLVHFKRDCIIRAVMLLSREQTKKIQEYRDVFIPGYLDGSGRALIIVQLSKLTPTQIQNLAEVQMLKNYQREVAAYKKWYFG